MESPFANPSSSTVTWFPDDGSRKFVEQALETHSGPRSRHAQKCLPIHTTDVKVFMDWGMQKADELGYEFFLDSTPYGRPLYEANSFVYVEENVNHPQTDNPDDKWREIDQKVGPFTFWLMKRPDGGELGAGKNVKSLQLN